MLLADRGREAPEPLRRLVVVEKLAVRVGGVDRGGQRFHHMARDAAALAHPVLHPDTFADVLEAVDAADQMALLVEQGIDIGEDGEPGAVRPLDRQFAVAHGLAAGQHLRHRGFLRSELPAVTADGPRSGTIPIGRLTQGRRATPQFHGPAVELHQQAVAVAGVDADREVLDQRGRRTHDAFQRQGRDGGAPAARTRIGRIGHLHPR